MAGADVVLQRVEASAPVAFVHIGLARLAHDDDVRTGYVRAGDVVSVMPMHPRQVAAELDEPPDWYGD